MAAADAKAKRREERVKLLASALSNLGVAAIVAGFISPSFGGRLQGMVGVEAFVAGFSLHVVAQLLLHYVVGQATPQTTVEPEGQE